MVFICDKSYDSDEYDNYFEKYPFELSDFQKYAIESIVLGNHILITAHTGSGKTLPAEFAIEYFTGRLKKVIYTSPIKALSNQKFYEFTKKFPNVNIGIMTGDIKFNPDADVLIMTTEILQNNLYKKLQNIETKSSLQFDINIDRDLECVIFDEVHYINDKDRGKVWEETIMMLPKHVQMVMLSATIDNPEKFASWCENRYSDDVKKVWLASSLERCVPLYHYSYVNVNNLLFKKIKDEEEEKDIKKKIGKPLLLKDSTGFKDDTIIEVNKIKKKINLHNTYPKNSYILNSLIDYLFKNEMLPALCFVFSRNNVEKYASEINVNLFSYDDAHHPSIIRDQCQKIIKKIPNYIDIVRLPEYEFIVSLLEKGIAIHHSGVLPILREMVEILYGKGYIKVLFATETFAVGINMPTKTVIFTSLSKFTEEGKRLLHSHEYTQMAGRAGRRGLDTKGYVIHCNNMFQDEILLNDYKGILSGRPQILDSKFKISYSLILNIIAVNKFGLNEFINNSMMNEKVQNMIMEYENVSYNMKEKINKKRLENGNINDTAINNYLNFSNLEFLSNKRKKEVLQNMELIKMSYVGNFDEDLKKVKELYKLEKELIDNNNYVNQLKHFVQETTLIILELLKSKEFVYIENDIYYLTDKGIIASKINEAHSLVMAELIYNKVLDKLSINDLTCLFSCFTKINIKSDFRLDNPPVYGVLRDSIDDYNNLLNEQENFEQKKTININNEKYILNYDIIKHVNDWCNAESDIECKKVLQDINDKDIFTGEFIKSILSINNVANEMIFCYEYLNNVPMLEKINRIQEKTLKHIAINQSLYI